MAGPGLLFEKAAELDEEAQPEGCDHGVLISASQDSLSDNGIQNRAIADTVKATVKADGFPFR